MNKELQIDDLTRGINDDEPAFKGEGQAEQGTAHPGDKCWQDFMAYLEAPTDGNGKADRLVCKLDRDLADSLDDCDIRGRCRSDLVRHPWPLPFRPRERHHPLVLREPPFPTGAIPPREEIIVQQL